jgi:hypothetical protein
MNTKSMYDSYVSYEFTAHDIGNIIQEHVKRHTGVSVLKVDYLLGEDAEQPDHMKFTGVTITTTELI